MNIGFFGVECGSANKGVAALAYSVINMFCEITDQKSSFCIFSGDSLRDIEIMKRSLQIENKEIYCISYKNHSLKSIRSLSNYIKEFDLIIDFTVGDSFSDIYGLRRLVSGLITKQMAISSKNTKFILGPQTYGPFYNKLTIPWVRNIINKTDIIYLRDKKSLPVLKKITNKPLQLVTDVALSLPWNEDLYKLESKKKKIGINVSGLLWGGGYTKDNQFNLKTDYQKYCLSLIENLLKEDNYEIYLIPHVIAKTSKSLECDLAACKIVKSYYEKCKMAPIFETPVEAKSFISKMDILYAARMHATIAAFSSGVPTVPLSYSRKFDGLYENLGYNVIVDLRRLNTTQAVKKSLYYLNRIEGLKKKVDKCNKVAMDKLDCFRASISQVVKELDG